MDTLNIAIRKKDVSIYKHYGDKIKFALILFIIGMIVGGVLTIYANNIDNSNMIQFVNEEDLIGEKPTFLSIFLNNVIVAVILCSGLIIGRVIPQVVICLNGVMLGIVITSYWFTDITFKVLLSLLPHSLLEIALLLFCASFGMKKYKKYDVTEYIKMLMILIIGFAFAAFIEVNVSYRMAQYFY